MDNKKIDEQFELLYKSKIERNVAPLEEDRIKIAKLSNIIISCCALLFLAAVVVSQITHGAQCSLYVWGTFVLSIIIYMCLVIPKKDKYRKDLKNKLLMSIFSVFGTFYYATKPVISLQEIKKNGLYKNASTKKDDDVIVGKYKDMEVSITETRLSHTSSFKNSKSEITDFSGLILRIKINKNFEGHTVVRQKPMSYEQFKNNMNAFQSKNDELIPKELVKLVDNPLVKIAFKGKQYIDEHGISFSPENGLRIDSAKNNRNKPKNLEEVNLEDAEFNNIFDIFSDNQVEARYLLTPSFMERLKNISMVMLVMNVHCIFKDGYITLFLGNPIRLGQQSDRGFFELEPGRGTTTPTGIRNERGTTLYNKEMYKRVFVELLTIFDFIHHFKLDQKIGL